MEHSLGTEALAGTFSFLAPSFYLAGPVLVSPISDILHLLYKNCLHSPDILLRIHLAQTTHWARAPSQHLTALPILVDSLGQQQRPSQAAHSPETPGGHPQLALEPIPRAPVPGNQPSTLEYLLHSKPHKRPNLPTSTPITVIARPGSQPCWGLTPYISIPTTVVAEPLSQMG